MFKFLKWGTRPSAEPQPASPEAASQLAPVPVPKVRKGPLTFPSFLKSTKTSATALPLNDRRLANTDVTTFRSGNSTRSIIRDFVAASPDLSASVFSYLRLSITQSYRAVARNMDGTANPEATAVLQQLLARFNVLTDYSEGFSGISSMQSNSESLARECVMYGSMAAELVLGRDRLPSRIQPISTTNIKFVADGKILRPIQVVGGEEIDLDVPTFFYVALDQDLLDPYSSSPLESAIKPAIFTEDFMNDIWRVVKKAIHPRVNVVIDEDKFRKNLPAEAQHNEEALRTYQTSLVSEIESQINGLAPEDALVYFDMLGISVENNGNISLSDEYKILSEIGNARLATGAKILPSLLGRAGSSNIASTETMAFMKNAAVVTTKLNELYSRMLTLAVRLFGHDVYVEFAYEPIDLRPESELESFRQTRQTRLLEQLSFGMITDEEACLAITGHLPPKGMPKLSGTMFKITTTSNGNPYNGQSNDGSTLNQNLKPDTPAVGRGGNNKAEHLHVIAS